jgi:hypothetical protein
MASFLNVGRMDRALRVVLGIGLGLGESSSLVILTLAGHSESPVSIILSGTCGI